MQKRLLVPITIVLGLVIVGCASLLGGGPNQSVSITSSPQEASYTVKTVAGVEMASGKTPGTVQLKRKNEYVVELSLSGYQDQKIILQKGMNGWFRGNILCGGIIGIIIDLTNGSAYKLEPGEINVELMTAMYEDGSEQLYAVLTRLDDEGQLRMLPVPMIPLDTAAAR